MHTLPTFLCGLLTAASIGAAAQPGRSAVKPADNPNCKMFSFAEMEKYLGKPIATIDHAAGGAGCQWLAKDEESSAIISVVGSRYFVAPKLGKGFKSLPKIGSQGYVLPELDGWNAGTVIGENGIVVLLSGKNKEAETIALLEEAVRRHRLADRPSPRAVP